MRGLSGDASKDHEPSPLPADLALPEDDAFTLAGPLKRWKETLPTLLEGDPQSTLKGAVAHGASDAALPLRGWTGPTAEFALGRELGRGGMGAVYEAEELALRRIVAIKLLLDTDDPVARSRFVAESRVHGSLEHPNIVPVYGLGRDSEGHVGLHMKRVRGQTLSCLLADQPAESPELLRRYVEILRAVCDAVAFAHSRGVIHRDLKCSNVMVGAFGEVQLMDWGLALTAEERASGSASASGGTPAFLAPEQAEAVLTELGPWTDVYLLGGMLYQILTGTAPHRGRTPVECLCQALCGAVEAPSQRAREREIPNDLEQLCLVALARDRERRTPSAEAFRAGLERHLEHREALRLLDTARRHLAEDPTNEELHRAALLLEQACELWPESEESRALLARTRLALADRALDGERSAAALALLDRAEEAGAHEETVNRYRQAARRQGTQRRTRIASALAIATLGVLLALGLDLLGTSATESARLQALTDLRPARHALLAVLGTRDLEALSAAVDSLAALDRRAGTGADRSLLARAATWHALRIGDERAAVAFAIPPSSRTELGQLLDLARLSTDPFAQVSRWRSATALEAWRKDAGEVLLLLASARGVGVAPGVRVRLEALGALGVVADLASGAPGALFPELPRFTRVRAPEIALKALGPHTDFLVAKAADGSRLWRFPEASFGPPYSDDAQRHPRWPLLIRDGETGDALVALLWQGDVVFLDARRGAVRHRVRTHAEVVALLPGGQQSRKRACSWRTACSPRLLPGGGDTVEMIQLSLTPPCRDRALRCTPRGLIDPLYVEESGHRPDSCCGPGRHRSRALRAFCAVHLWTVCQGWRAAPLLEDSKRPISSGLRALATKSR